MTALGSMLPLFVIVMAATLKMADLQQPDDTAGPGRIEMEHKIVGPVTSVIN
jgi:hypothetical protein